MDTTTDIEPLPPPWKLRGTIYTFPFWTNKSEIAAANDAGLTYSPLEANSAFASAEAGKHLGGMSLIQIIRYSESPAGPYDELILSTGSFEYAVEEADGKRVKKRHLRITRIYVSHKSTCWNGRKSKAPPFSSGPRRNGDGKQEWKISEELTLGRLEHPQAPRVV